MTITPAERWQGRDRHTVVRTDQPERVDHGASAVANLKAAGQNLVDMVDPTNHLRPLFKPSGSSNPTASALTTMFQVLMIPWAAAAEVIDLVRQPANAVVNLGHAAVHAALAGADAVTDRKD